MSLLSVHVQPSKQIVMDQAALNDLSEGLELMKTFSLPKEHGVSLEQLQSMVAVGPHGKVRRLQEAQ